MQKSTNYRPDIILFLLAILGGISFFWFFPKSSPAAKLHLQVNRNESLEIARDYIQSKGFEIENYSEFSTLYIKKMEESFLQENQVDAGERKAFEKFCPIAAWEVIFRNPEVNERFELLISPAGDVFRFYHVIPSNVAGVNLTEDEALQKFRAFLTNLWGINWSEYELIDAQSVSLESRTDHFFKLERKEEGIAGIKYRIWGVVSGENISGWDRHYQVPQDFEAHYYQKSGDVDFFEFGSVFIVIAVFVLALISFVMRFHAGEVSLRNSFIVASFSLIFITLYFANTFTSQSILRSAITEDNRNLYLLALYVNLAIYAFFSTLAIFFVWASGESMTRELWGEKLKIFDAIFAKKIFFPEIGHNILRGFSLAFIQLGLWYVALYFLSDNPNVWILIGSEQNQALSALVPFSLPVILALYTTTLAISYSPLFWLSFLKRMFKNTVIAVIATILVFEVFFNATFLIHSRWIQIVLSVLIGSIYYLYYLRYDLFTVAVGGFISYCLSLSMMFFVQPDDGFRLAGAVGLGSVVLLLIYGLAVMLRGHPIDEKEIEPHYIRNITERERLKMELDIARKAQLGMLPHQIPQYPFLDIAAFMEPAKEVGGDYYDFINIAPDKLGIVIGDVSGKGMPAALYMTLLKGFLQSHKVGEISPGKVLARINRSFYQTAERNIFVSVFYCIIDLSKQEMAYARAGHNPAIMLHSSDIEPRLLQPKGIAIGLDDGDVFDEMLKEESIKFEKGDVFLFYTDGLTEGRNKALEEFGENRLIHVLNQTKHLSAQDILAEIRKSYTKFVGKNEQHDDLTCLVVKIDQKP